jgi:hypothetical protein
MPPTNKRLEESWVTVQCQKLGVVSAPLFPRLAQADVAVVQGWGLVGLNDPCVTLLPRYGIAPGRRTIRFRSFFESCSSLEPSNERLRTAPMSGTADCLPGPCRAYNPWLMSWWAGSQHFYVYAPIQL